MSAGLPWFLISPLLANFQKQRHVFQRGAGIQLSDREMWASACACGLIHAKQERKALLPLWTPLATLTAAHLNRALSTWLRFGPFQKRVDAANRG